MRLTAVSANELGLELVIHTHRCRFPSGPMHRPIATPQARQPSSPCRVHHLSWTGRPCRAFDTSRSVDAVACGNKAKDTELLGHA